MHCASGQVEIRVGDCLDLLRQMPDQSVDAIVTDPPYAQTALKWDRWPTSWPRECSRVLKKTGSMWVFGTLRMFMDRCDEFSDWRFAEDIVWEKHNGSSFHADRFRRVHEQAVHWYRSDAPWSGVYRHKVTTPDAVKRSLRRTTGPQHLRDIAESTYATEDGGPRIMRSVIYVRSCHGHAVHPTQKPCEIVEPLVLNSCPPGGLILDPFSGSGTTGLVAARHGRRAILLELNPEYAEIARRRISEEWREPVEQSQDDEPLPLFGGAP